ncbi:MAG: hypothetical protein HUJ71_04790 [Pseudobutyrivibrio sp.]|nr:hypothetical protein [Pseudobutyrivibrio sp.]
MQKGDRFIPHILIRNKVVGDNKAIMLCLKMVKNVIMGHYYDNCMSINEYFNREIPLCISVLLSMMLQMSGGILLILLAIAASEIFDGYLFFLYFSALALLQSYFQSKRDFKTFDSLYEQTMFVYGYKNKAAIVTNAIAYSILNMVNNPMVFIPCFIYPLFLKKNIFIMVFQITAVLLTYCSMFLGMSNQDTKKHNKDTYGNIIYIIKTIALVLVMTYLFRCVMWSKQDLISYINQIEKVIKIYASMIFKELLLWMSGIITSIELLYVLLQYRNCQKSRCLFCGEEYTHIWKSKWVLCLARLCRDIKVKSDLLIIGRRRDLWKYNSNLAFLIPNTTILVAIYIVSMANNNNTLMDAKTIMITALVFEIAVIEKFIFQNMSFMLFYHAELNNLELFKKCNKDTKWLFSKKLKLMMWLSLPSVLFSIVVFEIIAAICKEYSLMPVIVIIAIGTSTLTAFLHLYWMFYYRGTYIEYEEFGTKKISLSMLNQLTSVPVGLLCAPFLMSVFNEIIGKVLFSEKTVICFIVYTVILSLILSLVVLSRSLIKYGK